MQTYMVDQPAVSFSFNIFEADPLRCEVAYTYSVEDEGAEAVISFFDANNREFTFEYT